MYLNVDDDCEMLKKIYCAEIVKKMDEVTDSNRTCIKTSAIITQDTETLNVCGHMLRTTSIKHDRKINKNKHVPMTDIENIEENVNVTNEDKVKRESRFKPSMILSTRRKKEQLS